ncbi:MAG TPA: two-component system response regulator [Rhodocyclaceae bacterium]|jgi:putative two-component system response regulator|nr:two-component system response regulator [Rhodocyclaceae bacterium]HMV20550.1 two-component system response regulator [Rhodocyclaceae bacterium]HNE41850.1 two-component system response regulator [Rhodocyclaceae bacterium]HNL22403.1 two-component system response regulator [Rhodocyclaceae bacterium]HNM21450.1 two-component system response regulator [Rhodocyclaceae bacterium]
MDSRQATILIVDDTPENLTVLGELLQPNYRVRAANSGRRALQIAAADPAPDLILLDVMMPEMDGYEVMARLRNDPRTREIPVVFVTAMDSTEAEERGLDCGAVDYITKPLRPAIVLARVRTQLELKQARDLLRDQNSYLEAEVSRRMSENQLIQEVSIHALARLAETRDPETGNHLRRTQEYVRTLAINLRAGGHHTEALSDRAIATLARSAPLHDIGKVGIPDHILLKPGKLTSDEWEIMKTHAALGSEAIAQAERDADEPVEFLAVAKEIAHFHHEKWDGSGYPVGLRGDGIPLSARLMALADVFDALISRRVYKPPMSFDEARSIIVRGSGSHFDPAIVTAFGNAFDQFCGIAERYQDDGPAPG